jgi:hypothetical protein
VTRRGRGLGHVKHWDVRNEGFPVEGVYQPAARAVTAARAATPRVTFPRFRQWRYFPQGNTPRCTLFGSKTKLGAGNVTHPAAFYRAFGGDAGDQAAYEAIVARDRAAGRYYDEGATTLAAIQEGVARGWWGPEYRWATTVEGMQDAIRVEPLLVGFNWYDTMWDRDAEGIVRLTARSRLAGGHFFCLNHYDAKRDLWRNPETWDDGDYWIPGDVIRRLLGEDGEAVATRELP